jgi:phosphopantetheinyl transferase
MVTPAELTAVPLPDELAHIAVARLAYDRLTDLPAAAAANLTAAEFAEWECISHPGRRAEWLAARLCLKSLIRQRTGRNDPRTLHVAKNGRGRPQVVIDGPVAQRYGDCSLTHAAPWAAAAWTDRPSVRLGVDVERISDRLQRVAGSFVAADDVALVPRAPLEQLTIWWCLKEACSKVWGLGLGAGLQEIACRETSPGRHELRRAQGPVLYGWHWRFDGFVMALCLGDAPADSEGHQAQR